MEGMIPDGYRPKMGRTKASQRQLLNLQEQVNKLSQRVAELENKPAPKPKAKPKTKKDTSEGASQE